MFRPASDKFLKSKYRFVFPFAWMLSSTALCFILIVSLFSANLSEGKMPTPKKYSIFSSKPLVLGASTTRIDSSDAKAAILDQVFEKYKCPLQGLGEVFVREADKNNIPYWLVAAVSFQESSCGKNTPTKDGVESHNAWGWGVYGDNIKMFDNWEHGIEVVSKYMSDKFHSKGITDPCEIMKTYTPPSTGSWCNGVKFFGDTFNEYKSPDNL